MVNIESRLQSWFYSSRENDIGQKSMTGGVAPASETESNSPSSSRVCDTANVTDRSERSEPAASPAEARADPARASRTAPSRLLKSSRIFDISSRYRRRLSAYLPMRCSIAYLAHCQSRLEKDDLASVTVANLSTRVKRRVAPTDRRHAVLERSILDTGGSRRSRPLQQEDLQQRP